MNFDHINFINAAHKLLTDGTLPSSGDVSSYLGVCWTGYRVVDVVFGMLAFDDP